MLAKFHRIFPNSHIYIAYGAIRTGKTYFLSGDFADWCIDKEKGRFFIVARTMTSCYDNVLAPIKEHLISLGYRPTQKGMKLFIKTNKLDIEIALYSANNSKSFERIQGGTFNGGFIDEAALMNEEMLETCEGRCITFPDYKIFMTTNPEGSAFHWYYKKYIENARAKGYIVMKLTLLDNPLFTIKTIEKYKLAFSDIMYQRKILGNWVQAMGSCFTNFSEKNINKMPADFKPRHSLTGCDIGYSNSATTLYTIHTDYKKIWITNECREIEDRSVEDNKKIIRDYHKGKKFMQCFIDSAEIGLIRDLSNERHFSAEACTKLRIQDRINKINTLFSLGILNVEPDCEYLIGAFYNAVYDNKEERQDNGTVNIDCLDGVEYGLTEIFDLFDFYEIGEEI